MLERWFDALDRRYRTIRRFFAEDDFAYVLYRARRLRRYRKSLAWARAAAKPKEPTFDRMAVNRVRATGNLEGQQNMRAPDELHQAWLEGQQNISVTNREVDTHNRIINDYLKRNGKKHV